MKKSVFIAFLFVYSFTFSQKICTISGAVTDNSSGEFLINANVYDAITLKGTITNNYGFYSLKLPAGKVKLSFSYIGYGTKELSFTITADTVINTALEESAKIQEILVTGEGPRQNVQNTRMGTIELPMLTAKQLPVLLGESDILKTLQLMPGVKGGTEGSSGLYVRGGGPDQNLILLDGVPVYNVNHLFGFFSVFNGDAISNVTLIKGGFPARYGGRLSSVIDVRMKEGNTKEYHGSMSLGLIASKFTIEGPITKDKTSFIVSGRRTYLDLISYPFQMLANKKLLEGEKFWVGYFFYDLNAKINHKFSDKSRLYFSSYLGRDKFFAKDSYKSNSGINKSQGGLKWGNITTALRWNYIISNELFSNITATFSNYIFKVYEKQKANENINEFEFTNNYSYEYASGITDISIKADYDYTPASSHNIKFGANSTFHTFKPGVNVIEDKGAHSQSIDTTFGGKNIPSNEFHVYCEDEMELGNRVKVNLGIHYSNFLVNKSLYHSVEPRISARFLISNNLSAKASYVNMGQYIHLLTNSTIGLPTDLWVPATSKIKPQKSWQTAVGITYSISDKYEISTEAFYKEMQNLIEYKEGSSFFNVNSDWEEKITSGNGQSYGTEVFIQKTQGKTTGWIGYTLSWAWRQFDDISFGEKFPFKYDRRHDISVVVTHKFNDRIDLGASWVFGTGNAFTLAEEKYYSGVGLMKFDNNHIYDNDVNMNNFTNYNVLEHFETRNNYRMPNYHRFDIGINLHKQLRRGTRTWSFGTYNTYNRQNPFFLYISEEYNDDYEKTKNKVKQVSLFPIIPYFRYEYKF